MSDDSIGEQLRAMCVDYDGSQMPDEAGPFNVRCGHLRSAADYIQRLEAERDEARAERGGLTQRDDPTFRSDEVGYWSARALAAESALTLARGEREGLRSEAATLDRFASSGEYSASEEAIFRSAANELSGVHKRADVAESRATSLLALVGEAETALTTISNGEGYIHEMTLDEVDAIILKLKAALHG